MINKQARAETEMLKEIAKTFRGTAIGGVGGFVLGGKAGKALFNRKLRTLSLPKKVIHKLRFAMSKGYRSNIDLDRKIWKSTGSGLGGKIGFQVGLAYDLKALARREAKSWGHHSRRRRASGNQWQYKAPGSDLRKSLKNLGIPKSKIKTKAEAKKFYRKRAKETHPDVNPGKSDKEFKEVTESWKNIMESGWYEKLAYVLRKQAAKKSKKKLLDLKKLKALIGEAGKGASSKVNVSKLMGRNLPKSFFMGLAAFGGGAALSRLASKASHRMALDSESK